MSDAIDKEKLYGKFQAGEDDRRARDKKLFNRAVHKALDIAVEDDVNITSTHTKTGIGTWGVVGIALSAALPALIGACVACYVLMKHPAPSGPQSQAPPFTVPDSEYDVLFYDKDGNQISVPHISTKPKG